MPAEDRMAWAMPSAQRRRIYEDVNHLRVIEPDLRERPLSVIERNVIAALLERSSKPSVPFIDLRKHARLSPNSRFTIERDGRKGLKTNGTSMVVASKHRFGTAWHALPLDRQDEIVLRVLDEEDEQTLIDWLMSECDLSADRAEHVATCLPRLPAGYGRLGATATRKILSCLEAGVIRYHDAVEQAGLGSHSALSYLQRTGVLMDALPYYGEVLTRQIGTGSNEPADPPEKQYGRIPNPTVHIGLNELRKVVNALVERYGRPEQIVVEVARELRMSREQTETITKQNKANRDRNEGDRKEIAKHLNKDPSRVSRDELLRWQLWKDSDSTDAANRCCPYTGRPISGAMVFSPEVELDHLIPWSRSLDDGRNNLVLCLATANADKGNRTPFEAFGHSPTISGRRYEWDAILARAKRLPSDKTKRFAEAAAETFVGPHQDFLARALTDTAYLSRLAREYLTVLCPNVWVIPGRLTAILRHQFGLDTVLGKTGEKNRDDHRHHAVDAVVVGVTDRSLLQRFATANARPGRRLPIAPLPWATFREHVERAVGAIVVSHRPDHNPGGALHDEANYGMLPDGRARRYVPVSWFKTRARIEETTFANPRLRDALLQATEPFNLAAIQAKHAKTTESAALTLAVAGVAHEKGIRRVRIIESLRVQPLGDAQPTHRHGVLPDGTPRPYKGVKTNGNHQLILWKDAAGAVAWRVITRFEANQPGHRITLPSDIVSPMVLHKGDYVSVPTPDGRRVLRVQKFGADRIVLVKPHDANADQRDRQATRENADASPFIRKSARSLLDMAPRIASVSPLGDVRVRT